MAISKITMLGATGFVGTRLVSRLANLGYRIKVLTRRRERRRHLLVIPTVDLVEADVHDPVCLEEQLAGSDTVINLVGILNESKDDGSGFRQVHIELARKVADTCSQLGVRQLLHMSALNADPDTGTSYYLRSKGEAEQIAHQAASDRLQVTSFRPSVIFGPGDDFFNRFASLLGIAPGVFPVACGEARFAPVYVDDVANAFIRVMDNKEYDGRHFDLCGPREYSLEELVKFTADTLGLRRWIFNAGPRFSRLQADILEHFPGKPFSRDNYRSLQIDSCCEFNGLHALEIKPVFLESVVPAYLADKSTKARFYSYRKAARRNLSR